MYTVYSDDNLLYSPNMEYQGYIIYDAMIEKEIDTVDSFEFTINTSHPFYNSIALYKNTIKVYSDSTCIFLGRAISYELDSYGNATFTCEGGIGFLNDEITYQFGEDIAIGTTVQDFYSNYIVRYNEPRQKYQEPYRLLATTYGPGYVPSMKLENEAISQDESDTFLTLFNSFVEQIDNLHYLALYSDKLTTIKLINQEYQTTNTNIIDTIEFGKNLTDISLSSNIDDAFSVIEPLGDYLYYTDPQTGELKQSETNRFHLTSPDVHGGQSIYSSDRIESEAYIKRLGYIVREVIFDSVSNNMNNPWQLLHNVAMTYFKNMESTTITVNAVKLDPKKVVNIGDVIEIIDPYHRVMNGKYMVTNLSIDLMDPSSTEYELNGAGVTKLSKAIGGQARYLSNIGKMSGRIYNILRKG